MAQDDQNTGQPVRQAPTDSTTAPAGMPPAQNGPAATQGQAANANESRTPPGSPGTNGGQEGYTPNSSQAPESMSAVKKLGIAILGILLIGGLVYFTYGGLSGNSPLPSITIPTSHPSTSASPRGISYCTSITSPGKYHLSGNVAVSSNKTSACISIDSSNVLLDGRGNRILGEGPYVQIPPYSYGIKASNVTNVTILNVTVLKFSYDIYLGNVSNSMVYDSNTINGTISGIYLADSHRNTIKQNTVFASSGQYGGIGLTGGGNNTVIGNIATDNAYYGLWINSSGNTFRSDNINNNPVDLACGINSELRYSNIFANSSCSVNNKCNFAYCSSKNVPASLLTPLPTTIRSCGLISSPGAYNLASSINMSYYTNTTGKFGVNACITIASPNVRLDCNNNTIYNAGYGIYLSGYYNDVISNCMMYNNTYGIYMANSFDDNITASGSTSGKYGAYFLNDTSFNVSDMKFTGNTYGIYLNSSFGLTFNKINATDNTYGTYYDSGTSSSFFSSRFTSNSKVDFFCSASNYNSTFETFQGNSCGLTDCNWASSCTSHVLVPLSVYPVFSCGTISVPGNYSLNTALISSSPGTCVTINASNVRFDCNGKLIEGASQGTAFYINGADNASIYNCDISKFGTGINAKSVRFMSITNTIINGASDGISLSQGNFSTISGIHVSNFTNVGLSFVGIDNSAVSNDVADSGITNATGFIFSNSYKNIITGNTGSSNPSYGFVFNNSRSNMIANNTAVSNIKYDYACNSGSSGIYANNGRTNTGITKNNCSWMVMSAPGAPTLCYSISKSSYVVLHQDMLYTAGSTCYYVFNTNSSSGKETTINCNGHTVYSTNGGTFVNINGAQGTVVENCNLIGFSKDVITNGRDTKVLNDTIVNSAYSVILNNTTYPSVQNDTFNNDTYGVYSQSSSYGIISGNRFINMGYGIYLSGGSAFKIIGNDISSSANVAISILDSQLNQLQNNIANGNTFGISCSQYATNSTANQDQGGNSCNSNNQCTWMTSSRSCKS